MHESDDDTPFTDHLLDQFGAYYTITVVAVQLFAQWRAHYNQTQMEQATSPKTSNWGLVNGIWPVHARLFYAANRP